MCKKNKGLHNRIDKCMKPLIKFLNKQGYKTVSSCCGHDKYPMTVVVKVNTISGNELMELLSETDIPRKRKYYVKDKKGYYFIPEVIK